MCSCVCAGGWVMGRCQCAWIVSGVCLKDVMYVCAYVCVLEIGPFVIGMRRGKGVGRKIRAKRFRHFFLSLSASPLFLSSSCLFFSSLVLRFARSIITSLRFPRANLSLHLSLLPLSIPPLSSCLLLTSPITLHPPSLLTLLPPHPLCFCPN